MESFSTIRQFLPLQKSDMLIKQKLPEILRNRRAFRINKIFEKRGHSFLSQNQTHAPSFSVSTVNRTVISSVCSVCTVRDALPASPRVRT